jgi:hypothetical protein
VAETPVDERNTSTEYEVAPVEANVAVNPVVLIELSVIVGAGGAATVAVAVVEPVPLNAVALAAVIVTVELAPAASPDTVKL